MEIILSKSYEINNLVSRTGQFSSTEFPVIVNDFINEFREVAVKNGELVISTTKAVQIVNDEQILSVEIYLPILYRIPIKKPYTYKNKLKLCNALYAKVEDVSKLHDAMMETNQYIVDKNIQPITSAYLIQTKQNSCPCVEIYIGINPNIL